MRRWRRAFVAVVGLLAGCAVQPAPPPATVVLFTADVAGTLSALRLDPDTGAGVPLASVAVGEPLEFLALHPHGHLVYGLGRQRVHAFAFDPGAGTLERRAEATTATRGTHLEMDRSGRFLFVASYGEHRLTVMPLDGPGLPFGPGSHVGGAEDPQLCRNAHQARIDPQNRFLYVPCLGSDHIAVLAFDAERGMLRPLPPAATGEGTGPRHLDFHPELDVLYVLNERRSSVCVFRIDPAGGGLSLLQTVSALPDGVSEGSRSSDIHVRPDGRFLYAINREPRNEVVVFGIGDDGLLRPHGRAPTGGVHARTFAIDPAGRWLLAANVRSADLTTFRLAVDGGLELVRVTGTGAGVMAVALRSY